VDPLILLLSLAGITWVNERVNRFFKPPTIAFPRQEPSLINKRFDPESDLETYQGSH
jgi:hypothetical protein